MPESTTRASDPFYVGYLPLPGVLQPVVKMFIGLGIVVALALAFIVSSAQQDPGPGIWDLDKIYSIEGHLTVAPYPVLHVDDPDNSIGTRAVLLVASTKFGVEDRTKELHGKRVRITGESISRQGRAMFALLDGDDAVALVGDGTKAPPVEQLGNHTMVGEICDSKCFLGVMKPGSGKTHRGCAVRCISGGIPPIFVTRDANGDPTVYLLTDTAHGHAYEAVLPFVAEPVELTGQLERHGDLLVYAVDTGNIVRK